MKVKEYNKKVLKINQDKMRDIAAELITPFKQGSIIFELGCAEGNFAKLLFDKNINNYIGVDILKKKVDIATRELPDMVFQCVDILKSDIMFNIGLFVSFQALEHIGTPKGKEDIDFEMTIQHPSKKNKRAFLFKGYRK